MAGKGERGATSHHAWRRRMFPGRRCHRPLQKAASLFLFCVFSPGLEGSRWRRLARKGFIGRRHSLRRSRMLSRSRRVRGQALALSRGAGGWSRTKAVALSDAGGARRGSEEKIAQRAAASRETYRGSNEHEYPRVPDDSCSFTSVFRTLQRAKGYFRASRAEAL